MSSFTRKKPGGSSSGIRGVPTGPTIPGGNVGTRPGPHGMHVISSGIDDLDTLFGGGGIPLGTLTIFSEDGWTHHDDLFLKYFVSEGMAVNHSIGIIVPKSQADSTSVGDYILKNISSKVDAAQQEQGEASMTKEGTDDTKLRIAWQYEKYRNPKEMHAHAMTIKAPRPALGASKKHVTPINIRTKSRWCHDFDISRSPSPAYIDDMVKQSSGICDIRVLPIDPSEGIVSQTMKNVTNFMNLIDSKERSSSPGSIGRVIIPHAGSLLWDDDDTGRGDAHGRLVNLFTQLRSLIHQRPIISIMATLPLKYIDPSCALRLRHIADAVFDLESVDETSQVVNLSKDPKTIAGHLEIIKLPAFGATKAPLPQTTSYVIRNKRKRLVIDAVEVDPDAEHALLEREAQGMNPASLVSKPPAPHEMEF